MRIRIAELNQVVATDCQPYSQKNKSSQEQTADNNLQSLNRRHERKDCFELVQLEISFLRQVHQRSDRTQPESAISQRKERCVQARPDTVWFGTGIVPIQCRHQREHANA